MKNNSTYVNGHRFTFLVPECQFDYAGHFVGEVAIDGHVYYFKYHLENRELVDFISYGDNYHNDWKNLAHFLEVAVDWFSSCFISKYIDAIKSLNKDAFGWGE